MSLEKPLEAITEDDLQTLETPEGKTIDYKESLPGNTYDDKKEFLADVSSFANASGGYLIIGIREENGVPVDVCGLSGIDPDAEILRLENMIRDNIEPRIPGVSMWPVPLSTSNVAIIVRIPHSWAQPHVVNYQRHWRFYSRNSAGKYPLDVAEVRTAFALSETMTERIRLFRTERLGKIVAEETPVTVGNNAKIVLHIIPFGAFEPSVQFDLSTLRQEDTWSLRPINARVETQRYNLDGLLTYCVSNFAGNHSYVQLFRNGIIEVVDTSMLRKVREEDILHIPSILFEEKILEVFPIYLRIQKRLGVVPPLLIMLTLLGVSGYIMGTNRNLDPFGDYAYPIDRDALVLPEVIIENFESDSAGIMRPIFDSVWNATGWPRSMNYDETGEWGKGKNCRK